ARRAVARRAACPPEADRRPGADRWSGPYCAPATIRPLPPRLVELAACPLLTVVDTPCSVPPWVLRSLALPARQAIKHAPRPGPRVVPGREQLAYPNRFTNSRATAQELIGSGLDALSGGYQGASSFQRNV